MSRFLSGKPSGPLETPIHGFAILSGLALVIVSARAWRKQITEKFLGKTFVSALIVGLVWIVMLAVWQYHYDVSLARGRIYPEVPQVPCLAVVAAPREHPTRFSPVDPRREF